MRILVTTLSIALSFTYPLAVFWALSNWSARSVGLIGLVILVPFLVVRLWGESRERIFAVLQVPLVVMALLLLSAVIDDPRFVLALPVVINVSLLLMFAGSLRARETVIERFARLRRGTLNAERAHHCRQATVAWSAFFAVNALVAGILAVLDSREAWALYNGGIAYALMGLMALSEYVVRQARFRDYGRGPFDRVLSRLFPPRKAPGVNG